MNLIYLLAGAGRGFGLEMTWQLLAAGHKVVAAAKHPDEIAALKQLAAEYKDALEAHALDLSKPQSIYNLAQSLQGRRIDVLINNSALDQVQGANLESVEDQELIDALDQNVVGTLRLARALKPCLLSSRAARFVNLVSAAAPETIAFNVVKAALDEATEVLAREMGPRGIVCAAIHLGGMRTNGQPDEAIAHVLQLVAKLRASDNGRILEEHSYPALASTEGIRAQEPS